MKLKLYSSKSNKCIFAHICAHLRTFEDKKNKKRVFLSLKLDIFSIFDLFKQQILHTFAHICALLKTNIGNLRTFEDSLQAL